jgi:hypothetical protein
MQRIDTSFELWWFIAAEYFFYSRVTSENTSTGIYACKQSGKKLLQSDLQEKIAYCIAKARSIAPRMLGKADHHRVGQSDLFITCE